MTRDRTNLHLNANFPTQLPVDAALRRHLSPVRGFLRNNPSGLNVNRFQSRTKIQKINVSSRHNIKRVRLDFQPPSPLHVQGSASQPRLYQLCRNSRHFFGTKCSATFLCIGNLGELGEIISMKNADQEKRLRFEKDLCNKSSCLEISVLPIHRANKKIRINYCTVELKVLFCIIYI